MTTWDDVRRDIITEVRALKWEGRSDETSMPPCQDTRAEVRLLGCMLRGTEADPEWFYDDLHAWLAQHITTARESCLELNEAHLIELAGPRGIARDTVLGLWDQVQFQPWCLDGAEWACRVQEMSRRRVLCSQLRRVIVALETDQRDTAGARAYLRRLADDT